MEGLAKVLDAYVLEDNHDEIGASMLVVVDFLVVACEYVFAGGRVWLDMVAIARKEFTLKDKLALLLEVSGR